MAPRRSYHYISISPYVSLHLPTSPCISLHLPTSPYISPHLPTSPYISLGAAQEFYGGTSLHPSPSSNPHPNSYSYSNPHPNSYSNLTLTLTSTLTLKPNPVLTLTLTVTLSLALAEQELYRTTRFTVVLETSIDSAGRGSHHGPNRANPQVDPHGHQRGRVLYVTEKPLKPMLSLRPFVLLGSAGGLATLRSLGLANPTSNTNPKPHPTPNPQV